jgi:hypothetical protein
MDVGADLKALDAKADQQGLVFGDRLDQLPQRVRCLAPLPTLRQRKLLLT